MQDINLQEATISQQRLELSEKLLFVSNKRKKIPDMVIGE